MSRRHRRRNERAIGNGAVMRASEVAGGSSRRGRDPGRLIPCLASRPAGSDPIDAEALASELVRLAEMARRAPSS
jgi:hypothetical protein